MTMNPRPGWDTDDWSGLPPVAIHPYDPTWTEQFEHARWEIADALAGLAVRIEHVGSTAVPGLGARQGIDILIGLGEGSDVAACVERLQRIGFQHHFSKPDWTHLSRPGCKLHLTPLGSSQWSELLLFRDYLRRHPEAASAYHQLKQDLADQYGADGRRYVEGKTAFVRSVVGRARREDSSPASGT
jgi:GrpB-like predicted nucleotidyltransferase (UPF0157 family)